MSDALTALPLPTSVSVVVPPTGPRLMPADANAQRTNEEQSKRRALISACDLPPPHLYGDCPTMVEPVLIAPSIPPTLLLTGDPPPEDGFLLGELLLLLLFEDPLLFEEEPLSLLELLSSA